MEAVAAGADGRARLAELRGLVGGLEAAVVKAVGETLGRLSGPFGMAEGLRLAEVVLSGRTEVGRVRRA